MDGVQIRVSFSDHGRSPDASPWHQAWFVPQETEIVAVMLGQDCLEDRAAGRLIGFRGLNLPDRLGFVLLAQVHFHSIHHRDLSLPDCFADAPKIYTTRLGNTPLYRTNLYRPNFRRSKENSLNTKNNREP